MAPIPDEWAYATTQDTRITNDVVWSPDNNLFVAVGWAPGGNARGISSADGQTWGNAGIVFSSNALNSITYGNGLFVAVGMNGAVQTSPDGSTWTIRTSPAYHWRSVTYSPTLDRFVAVAQGGAGGRAMYSDDGINWTDVALPGAAPNGHWYGVAWSADDSRFVAVGWTTTGVTTPAMFSSDGTSWTTVTGTTGDQWTDVAYSPALGRFVAVGATTSGSADPIVMYSDNGGSGWTRLDAAALGLTFGGKGICWSAERGLFVAGCAAPGAEIHVSSDGINWAEYDATVDNLNLESVAYSPSLDVFVSVGRRSSTAAQVIAA